MSSLKTIKLYDHAGGPNPPKVKIILQELGVPYESVYPDKIKEAPYTDINPNGRLPAIEDPNTGLTLWESGAIIEYLIEQYDTEGKLHYTSFPEKWQQSAWKMFQMSGQGPYFGQRTWFGFFHAEKIPSAIDRYSAEIKRVLGVIDAHLTKTGQPYLVGPKICYADLMFVTWNHGLPFIMGEEFMKEFEEKMPKAYQWTQELEARESVKKVYADVAEYQAKHGQKH